MITARQLLKEVTIGLCGLALVVFLCAFVGSEPLSVEGIVKGRQPDAQIFFQVRIPRLLLAVLVGASLASAGAAFQVLLRNPLAEPYILGISSGAGLGVMTAVLVGVHWSGWGLSGASLLAFVGAAGTTLLVWWLGGFTGRTVGPGLILAGVIVNVFFSAVMMLLASMAPGGQFQTTLFWLMGCLSSYTDWPVWLVSVVLVGAGFGVLFRLSPQLNILSLGTSEARSLGVVPERLFPTALAAAALMTSTAVSLSGLIGFVGLIVPHSVRLLFGADHRRLLPMCAIFGAVFLVISDTIARILIHQVQLPTGVVTALAGGPFFLFLLIRQSKQLYGGTL
ncbi:MAG TPA: iron ABC transporter permease [Anaerohalosphaeraceae bacterium]|nr:iron ABC transporter permease [Anaerohalosphaeraceae bacterium]HOL89735.1 iron ABC transporter permease [Anaerohalosphaeraceae bacterium]